MSGTGGQDREAVLAAMHDATRRLMHAETSAEITDVAVETARDTLGETYSTVFLWDEDEAALLPVANTEAAYDLFGDPPTFEFGQGIAGEVYEAGEHEHLADGQTDPRAHQDASERIRAYIAVPVGEFGVITFASPEPDSYDAGDVELAQILAANVEAALERAERERELRRRRAVLERQNERLDEFASVVSHDLRNPLSVARGHLDLYTDDCEVGDHLRAVADALDRMDTLVADLLTLARGGDAVEARERVTLSSVARDAWTLVDTPNASLSVEGDRRLRADPSKLAQVFENLFRNCLDHGRPDDQSRELLVTVGPVEDGFFVADDGVGIPEDERERLFEAGFSTGGTGTGLGLNIVQTVVEAHGWTIVATNRSDDGGAHFEVTGVETVPADDAVD